MAVVYAQDRRAHGIRRGNARHTGAGMTDRMLSIALPLAAASYARSGLSTVQHLLVPVGLRASGLGAETALADYGIIQGMALPVVLFPSCVLMAAAELLVPKLTMQQVQSESGDIRDTAERTLGLGFRFAALCAALLFALGGPLGQALYDSADAGRFIRLFALIVPVMYLDMLTDGCLKGLGDMMFCMLVNIADAGLSALMVWLLLPRWGLGAYIATICFTELFNFVLSYVRLRKKTGLRPDLRRGVSITALAAVAGAGAWALNKTINAGNSVPALIVSILFGCLIYGLPRIIGGAAGRPASCRPRRPYW